MQPASNVWINNRGVLLSVNLLQREPWKAVNSGRGVSIYTGLSNQCQLPGVSYQHPLVENRYVDIKSNATSSSAVCPSNGPRLLKNIPSVPANAEQPSPSCMQVQSKSLVNCLSQPVAGSFTTFESVVSEVSFIIWCQLDRVDRTRLQIGGACPASKDLWCAPIQKGHLLETLARTLDRVIIVNQNDKTYQINPISGASDEALFVKPKNSLHINFDKPFAYFNDYHSISAREQSRVEVVSVERAPPFDCASEKGVKRDCMIAIDRSFKAKAKLNATGLFLFCLGKLSHGPSRREDFYLYGSLSRCIQVKREIEFNDIDLKCTEETYQLLTVLFKEKCERYAFSCEELTIPEIKFFKTSEVKCIKVSLAGNGVTILKIQINLYSRESLARDSVAFTKVHNGFPHPLKYAVPCLTIPGEIKSWIDSLGQIQSVLTGSINDFQEAEFTRMLFLSRFETDDEKWHGVLMRAAIAYEKSKDYLQNIYLRWLHTIKTANHDKLVNEFSSLIDNLGDLIKGHDLFSSFISVMNNWLEKCARLEVGFQKKDLIYAYKLRLLLD